jgi:hypothetical protein
VGRKPSREDRILSVIIKIFLAPFTLLAYTLLGFIAPLTLLLGPIAGVVYFVKITIIEQTDEAERPKLGKRAVVPLLRGIVVGTIVAAALVAPLRGLAFLATEFSGIEKLQIIFSGLSAEGAIDAWLGLIGVVFTIPAGFAAWHQSLRMKTQIENIPTSKTRSAALGLAEFKGIARVIEDESLKMTEVKVNAKRQASIPEGFEDDSATSPILLERWVEKENKASKVTEIRSRFHLEDDTGRILVDPRGVWFWNGEVEFFSPSARSIFLKNNIENRSQDGAQTQTRRLDPGDEVYLIGAVEELEDGSLTATGGERLIVRPSSELKSTNLLRRIILGNKERIHRKDIYDVFFLTDINEADAAGVLTKGINNIWVWVVPMVALSIPLLVEHLDSLFDWRSLLGAISNIF